MRVCRLVGWVVGGSVGAYTRTDRTHAHTYAYTHTQIHTRTCTGGSTALHLAVEKSHFNVVEEILTCCASPELLEARVFSLSFSECVVLCCSVL